MQRRTIALLLGLLLATSWAASFFLVFNGVSVGPPISLAAWQALVGALVAAGLGMSLQGPTGFRGRAAEAWRRIGIWPMVFVAGFYVLQVVRRFTEGQSGANVFFIMGLAPVVAAGAVLVKAGRRYAKTREALAPGDLLAPAAIAVATLGIVGILANWERPSSFSPFTIFPREELMLLAGVSCWVAFLFYIRPRARDIDAIAATAVVLGGSGLLMLLLAVVGEGPSSLAMNHQAIRLAVVLGVIGAATGCYSWIAILKLDVSVIEAASMVLASPVLASLLIVVDQAVGLTGANPMIGEPVFAGSILALLGLALVWLARWWSTPASPEGWGRQDADDAAAVTEERPREANTNCREQARPSRGRSRILVASIAAAAAVGLLGAAAALVLPVRLNDIQGMLHDEPPFAAQWTTQGYEAAGAWVALMAGVLLLLVVWRFYRGDIDPRRAGVVLAASLAMLVCVPTLADSVFVAWRSWIPTQVQHAIGTEYVRLSQTRVANPAFLVVYIGYGVAFALAIVKILWKEHKPS